MTSQSSMGSCWKVFGLLFAFVTVAPLSAALDFERPPRDGIYDPRFLLDENFRQMIRQRITYEKTTRELELFVVLFPQALTQPIEPLISKVGAAWAKGEYWCVVYQVGQGEPECVVGGRIMNELPDEAVSRTIRNARNAALMVTTPQNRLEEIVNNLADGFGLLYKMGKQNFDQATDEARARFKEDQRKRDLLKFGLGLVFVLLILAIVVGYFLWNRVLRRFLPQGFPLTSPRKRLGGAVSGGGDVLVKFDRT
jgi:hypothetical protein